MGLMRKTRTRRAYTRMGCILDLALPHQSVEADAPNSGAPLTSGRVCQAWHRTSEVQVLVPGMRGAEG
jgi:hypothetical protein